MRTHGTLVRSIVVFLACGAIAPGLAGQSASRPGRLAVIVRAADAGSLAAVGNLVTQAGGVPGRALSIINGQVAYLPAAAVAALARNPLVAGISPDRPVGATMERTGATIGSTTVRQAFGYDGTGVGVAVIDSGVAASHEDLAGSRAVAQFVDFVNGAKSAYDDYGHGTHVAGIVAGSGSDSSGRRVGVAPGAKLVVLKALDANGSGTASDVIAALDYIVKNRDKYNIRVANLSVAAGVYESYLTDPLTLAAKKAVEAGIVVVAAAGNGGHNTAGGAVYGGVTAPANAPWVLTVGAASHMGTTDRTDDTIAAFSSRGPSAYDFAAKPDLVAPGVGIESLSAPNSTLYTAAAGSLLSGSVQTSYLPYLSLTGTSMAAPVVSGTVALMLQANPSLTPNAVKAILQYTSQIYPGYDTLTMGAGFLNAQSAVELARNFAAPSSGTYTPPTSWSGQVIWGNQRVTGGLLTPTANAWSVATTWGAATASSGQPAQWGVICTSTCGPWQLGTATAQNVVWGATCGESDCSSVWTLSSAGGSVTTTSMLDTVVWGSSVMDTVVWGSSTTDTVVWGSSCTDASCGPIVWPIE